MENDQGVKELQVAFVTQDTPFYARIFFEELLGKTREGWRIAEIVRVSLPVGGAGLRESLHGIHSYGLLDFLRTNMRFFHDRWRGRTLEQLCREHGIPFSVRSDCGKADFADYCRRRGFDLIASVASTEDIDRQFGRCAPLGCLSLQHDDGTIASFWRLYYNEKTSSIRVYRFTGSCRRELLAEDTLSLWVAESLDHLLQRLRRRGAECLAKALASLDRARPAVFPAAAARGKWLQHTLQDAAAYVRERMAPRAAERRNVPGAAGSAAVAAAGTGSRYRQPTRDDVQEFHRRGKRIF